MFQWAVNPRELPTHERKMLEVMVVWRETPIEIRHFSTLGQVTVGTDARSDLHLPHTATETTRYTLIEPAGDSAAVRLTDTMSFEVQGRDGHIIERRQLEQEGSVVRGPDEITRYALRLHERIAVQLGPLTLLLRFVLPPSPLAQGARARNDYRFGKVFGFAFLAHAFVLGALLVTPPDVGEPVEDMFKNPNRFAQLIIKEMQKKPDPKRIDLEGAMLGGKRKDKEGKFGKTDKPREDKVASTKGAPRVDSAQRERDRRLVMSTGIFAALKAQGGAASDVFGPGGLGSGINDALGGLRGSGLGNAGGSGGLGGRGAGPGGGGGSDSLSIGGLGNGIGRGTGGAGNLDLGGRGRTGYTVGVAQPLTKGCMTGDAVMRVLRKATSRAKYCYEKALQSNPSLEGKVTTRFVIGPGGDVQSADVAESTMDNPEVERCLVRMVQALSFPPCSGGGVAEVTYPWIFKSGGGVN